MEKVFIAGGTGFVGVNLANRMASGGYAVAVMGPSGARPTNLAATVAVVKGDGRVAGDWQKEVAGSAVIINLAGAPIFTRWTPAAKKTLRESRVLTTAHIVEALPADGDGTLISTSAVGYYGFHGDEDLDEESPPGEDFLARLCGEWEEEALRAEKKGARVVLARFGLVLGRGGGVLGKMIPAFRWFLGGPLGTGKQWFSWVHMEDLLGALSFLMDQPAAEGAYNITAPCPVTNGELARTLGRVLHRPALLPAPAAAVRLGLGELGDMVLKGQRALPRRLLDLGYRFRYEDLETALTDVLRAGPGQ